MKNIISIISLLIYINIFATNDKDSISVLQNHFAFMDEECDACGCSVGGASSGFESVLSTNFIGVKYLSQHYKSKKYSFEDAPNINEYYNTILLWAKIPVWKNLEIYASVPYQFHEKGTTPKQRINGLGDISAMAIYRVIKSGKESGHILNVGAGLKIPTGKFNEANATSFNPSFQVGTGSWDYTGIISYSYSKNNFGLQTSTDYIFKNQNKKYYRFGDQWNSQLNLYYLINYDHWKLCPKIGFQYEKYFQNVQLQEKVQNTGGNVLLGKLGLEASVNRFNIGFEFQNPFISKFDGGMVDIVNRTSLFINYSL